MGLSTHCLQQFLPLFTVSRTQLLEAIFSHSFKHSEIAPALFDSLKDVPLLV